MATIRVLGSTFNTNSGTKTVTATPAVGELIVIVAAHTGNVADVVPTDDNADGLNVWGLMESSVKNSSSDGLWAYARRNLIGSATSTIFSHAPGATTGGGIVVLAVSGMTFRGWHASLGQNDIPNQTAGTTPTNSNGAAAESQNLMLAVLLNASNPGGVTLPSGFTSLADVGYNTPSTGLQVCYKESGFTDSTVTWGSTSATEYAGYVIEFETRSLQRQVKYNEPFTHADENPISLSGTWDSNYAVVNSAQIVSNTFAATTTGNRNVASYNAISLSNDQYAKCKFTTWTTGTGHLYGGPIVRAATPTTATWYELICNDDTNKTQLSKMISGTPTAFTGTGVDTVETWAVNDVAELWVYTTQHRGERLLAFRNGVPMQVKAFDTAITSGRAGIGINPGGGAALSSIRADDFEAGNLEVASNPSVSDALTMSESVTLHMPIHLRMVKLS